MTPMHKNSGKHWRLFSSKHTIGAQPATMIHLSFLSFFAADDDFFPFFVSLCNQWGWIFFPIVAWRFSNLKVWTLRLKSANEPESMKNEGKFFGVMCGGYFMCLMAKRFHWSCLGLLSSLGLGGLKLYSRPLLDSGF